MKGIKTLPLLNSLFLFQAKLNAQAPESRHSVGIAASALNGLLGLLVPIGVTDQFSMAPALSINIAFGVGSEWHWYRLSLLHTKRKGIPIPFHRIAS